MGKRIPKNKVDEIYAAMDIVEVVQDFVQLKKRGSNYFGLSPWSSEKTPSFAVSPTKNIFKDFSSGRGGSSITFLMELEGMTYVEALEYLAKKFGIELEYEDFGPQDKAAESTRESLLIISEFATKFFQDKLLNTDTGRKIALSYLKERGLLEATIEEFRLGYSPDEWDALASVALESQYEREYLIGSGLCFPSRTDESKLLDRFKGRLMFPILNHLGKVVGFGGRVLGKQENVAKYINSPETDIYHKSKVLYGLHQSKQQIRDLDQVFLVEGYMDVISLFQSGVRNVCATSGTALTEDQIRLIKRFTKNVTLLFDSDRAGIKAALRGIELCLEKEIAVKVLLLPEGHDPDSYVKEFGKSGFEAYAKDHSSDFLEFRIEELKKTLDPEQPSEFSEIIHETASTIARIPDQVQQAVYMQFAARLLKIDESILRNALKQAMLAKAQQDRRSERIERNRQAREQQKRQEQLPLDRPSTGSKEVPPQDEVPLGLYDSPESYVPPDDYIPPDDQIPDHAYSPPVADTAAPPVNYLPSQTESLVHQEEELLRVLINNYDQPLGEEDDLHPLIVHFMVELEDLNFEIDFHQRIREKLFEQYEKEGKINIDFFLHHDGPEMAEQFSRFLVIHEEVSKGWEKFDIKVNDIDEDKEYSLLDAVFYYKRFKVKKLLKETRLKIRDCKESEELDKLIKVHMHLLEMRKELENHKGIIGGVDANITKI